MRTDGLGDRAAGDDAVLNGQRFGNRGSPAQAGPLARFELIVLTLCNAAFRKARPLPMQPAGPVLLMCIETN